MRCQHCKMESAREVCDHCEELMSVRHELQRSRAEIARLRAELEGERNAVNALRIAVRVARVIPEEDLADMIAIARGDGDAARQGGGE